MTASQAKLEARAAAKTRRAAAHAALGGDAASRFADLFFAHVPLQPGAVIAGYAAIGDEADPSEILALAAARGHPIALPRVAAPASPLIFHLWTSGDPLEAGPHGTRHPAEDAAITHPALLLVPLLAFDGNGHRLGYGGGYYDRTLAALRKFNHGVIAVGLAFSVQEVTHLPHEPEDEPLDWIVTEHGARAFSGQIK
jgi:5-formyltetrahydrofolate cyclo-ligase